jgi:hypothetical protein
VISLVSYGVSLGCWCGGIGDALAFFGVLDWVDWAGISAVLLLIVLLGLLWMWWYRDRD